jgi:hypothetical protein
MILGMPADASYNEYHHRLYNERDKGEWYDDILDEHKIPYSYGHPRKNTIFGDAVFILTTPSLNLEGGTHAVIATSTFDGNISVFDPVKGWPSKKYYVWGKPAHPNEVELTSWTVDIIIPARLEIK